MRLFLLLSFLLPGFLVTVADVAPDYEHGSDKDTLYENPAVPVSTNNARPAPKYKDTLEDEEESPELKVKPPIDDRAISNGNDYGVLRKLVYPNRYLERNYLSWDRRSVPFPIRSRPRPVEHPYNMNYSHSRPLRVIIDPISRNLVDKPHGSCDRSCPEGYRDDCRGHCRKVLH